ncbi:MAG: 2-C-methyl-D-erythritol 4-phosphate cytidylyltransferase [Bacillaceae bacterium]|nr:2-C-methyl-D-erythritol 4-phosphate cytidylyltransferase [Bacillaceae bacterium]
MEYSVVIPAAGQGKRMKAKCNKQFLEIEGKPIIAHTLEVFQSDEWCTEIVVVGNALEIEKLNGIVEKYRITKVTSVLPGGQERQHSVYNGLNAVTGNSIVLIHDGARPFLSQKYIHKLVIEANKTGGAILAVPMKDTVKEVIAYKVSHTVDRNSLWSVQTPQAFLLPLILSAHESAKLNGYIGTDDASLLERMNSNVAIVEGDYFNIKITTQEDLIFAKAILVKKRGGFDV